MFSSFNGSFSKGRRASSTKFGYKRNKLIAYYDTTNASSYSGTGTTFTDLSTSANNGTISGGPTYSADGYFTWTSSDYIVTTDLDDQITGASPQHTVEVWIYPTGNGVVTQYCGSATPNTGYHHSGIEIVSGNLEFGLWSGSGITSTGPTEAISLNEWHQVVMTYNGTTVKGYLDGELVGSVNVTWDDPMDSAGNFFLVFGAADVTNQGDGSIFDGRFGLMRVYRRALGVRDILRNYNNDRNNWLDTDLGEWSPATDITPAYWLDASDTSSYTLSGSTLNTVTDKAGNFTVSIDGSPTRISSSLNSLNVWDFDGSESLITGSGPYTSSGNHWAIGVFQYHATDSTKDSFFSASGTRTYAVSSSQSNNTWTGEIDYDGSNSIVTGTAKNNFTTSISQNTWVIVSIVFNKTGNQIFGRINGETATSTDAYNLAMDTNATDVRMMRNRAGVKLDGRMAEYFHVAGVPGTGGTDITDVEKAEGYIAHKWGLEGNLPADHPYKSEAPGGVVRTFTSNGKWTCPPGVESVDYLVVGGGGGGGNGYDTGGGGGGSGGTVLTGTLSVTPYYTYDITVGAGGTGGADTRANNNGSDGGDSIFSTVTASGGDAGNASRTVQRSHGDGGDAQSGSTRPQGGDGGGNASSATAGSGGGGGGAGGAGSNGSSGVGGAGGVGTSSSISGSAVTYGAGGAGARGNFNTTEGANGSANTGNGGGGGGAASANSGGGGTGGSGIVIISY